MAKCKSAVIANLLIDELTKEINAALIDPNTKAPSRWVTDLDDDHHPHSKDPRHGAATRASMGIVLIIQRR